MKLIVLIGALSILYAQLYALWDVLARHSEMSFALRLLWLIGIVAFPVVGTVAYLRAGPGAEHWPPWESEHDD